MTSPAALHSADSDEHFTPFEITNAAAGVLGRIDLDPFSCASANSVVGATMFYGPGPGSSGDDGYAEAWGSSEDPQRLFINPPGKRVLRKPELAPKPLVKPGAIHAWWRLLDEYRAGTVQQAIFLSFNMNLFQTAQRFGYAPPFRYPFCVPDRRLKFWGESRAPGEGSPSHASAIIYMPPRSAQPLHVGFPAYALEAFRAAFSPFGEVRL